MRKAVFGRLSKIFSKSPVVIRKDSDAQTFQADLPALASHAGGSYRGDGSLEDGVVKLSVLNWLYTKAYSTQRIFVCLKLQLMSPS